MELRFPIGQIRYWADRYGEQNGEQLPLEQELIDLRPQVLKTGYLTRDHLASLARWKSQRSANRIARNDERFVNEITRWSFTAGEERSRIEVLTLLDGVKWPTASVVVHLFHRDRYPILDSRALWSVQEQVPKQYRFDFWWEYVKYCRVLADETGLDMRTLDRALWQYSKDNQ